MNVINRVNALGHTFLRHFNYFQYTVRKMTHVQRIMQIFLCWKYVLYPEALERVETNFGRVRSQCTKVLKGKGCRDTGLFKGGMPACSLHMSIEISCYLLRSVCAWGSGFGVQGTGWGKARWSSYFFVK